ncbi:MAG: SusC/RagA family TonB-linked outer membrane protein, partial [Cytophagaceae bacterium]
MRPLKFNWLASGLLCLLLLPLSFSSFAQAGRGAAIRGRVTSGTEALPGVNVILKGTQQGTTTDVNGQYSLTLPDGTAEAATLTFSYIGYASQEVKVGNRTTIDVSLVSDDRALSEVVVVGYGTQRKVETTGAIASVKAADLVQTPVANVAQGLQSRVAGVQVNQNTGAPGGNISVRIRGTNSINGNSEPLYVVDGVPYTAGLSNLNTEDIASISILKDAASTALYGSRATNGVVMITTKRGKKDRVQVNVRALQGVSSRAIPEYERVNAYEYYPLMWEAYRNSLVSSTVTNAQAS